MTEIYESVVIAPIEALTTSLAGLTGMRNTPIFRAGVLSGSAAGLLFFLQPKFAFTSSGKSRPWSILEPDGRDGVKATLLPWWVVSAAAGAFGIFFI